MENEQIQLKHRMLEDVKFNLTHRVLLQKVMPGSSLFELQKAAETDHSEYVRKLVLDQTKNDAAKRLLSAQHAEGLLMKLVKQIDSEKVHAASLRASLEDKLSEALTPAEPLATDSMARQLAFSNIKDMDFAEVVGLIRQGDRDVAKAMATPLARVRFKLTAERLKTLQTASEQALLNVDEHRNLRIARKADDAFTQMGEGLSLLADRSFKIQKSIGGTVVESD